MHVELGGYHVGDVEFVAAFDVDAAKVGVDLSQGHLRRPQQHDPLRRRRPPRRDRAARPDPRRARVVLPQTVEESPAEPVDVAEVLARQRRRRARELPAGGLRGGPAPLRPGVPRRRRRLRERHPGLHRQRPEWARKFRDAGIPIVGRRHQEPGGGHHRPPGAHPAVRGPWPGPRPHLPAQLRREHGLHEHARARAPRVEEGLEDPGRDEPGRELRARRRRRPHRPVRPRALAERPQVGLHPHGGPQLRRRARSTWS